MAVTFQDKVTLLGNYKDKEGYETLIQAYKFGKNIDSPKLNDAQRNQIRANIDRLYAELSAQIKKQKSRESKSASGAKKKTVLGLASEIRKRENITWDKAKAKARMEFQSERKKAIREEKQELADFKKTIGKIKFLRATTYKKRGKIVSTDIKKDKVIPALPSGKRYPKRGKTTNGVGTFDNNTKKPYWENRANRMDVNQPSKQAKIKLADGGEMEKPLSWYQYETKKVRIAWRGKIQPFGMFKSAEEALDVIQERSKAEPWEMEHYSIVTPNKVIHLGKEYPIRFAKGGEVKNTIDILMTEENKVWDKFGFSSGSEIRASKDKTKKYAQELERVFTAKGVKKGSLTKKINEDLTDENYHLLNEFLTRNGYFNSKLTDELLKSYNNPAYSGVYADKEAMTIEEKAKPKTSGTKKIQFKKLSAETTYIPKREIDSIELESGETLSKNDIIDGVYRTKKKFANGGEVDESVTAIAKAIFDANEDNGKISTSFGKKTFDEFVEMVEQEDAYNVYYNIWRENAEGKYIATTYGDKTYDELLEMLKIAKNENAKSDKVRGKKYYAVTIVDDYSEEPQEIRAYSKEEMLQKLVASFKKTFPKFADSVPYSLDDFDREIGGTYISDDWAWVTSDEDKFDSYKRYLHNRHTDYKLKNKFAKGGSVKSSGYKKIGTLDESDYDSWSSAKKDKMYYVVVQVDTKDARGFRDGFKRTTAIVEADSSSDAYNIGKMLFKQEHPNVSLVGADRPFMVKINKLIEDALHLSILDADGKIDQEFYRRAKNQNVPQSEIDNFVKRFQTDDSLKKRVKEDLKFRSMRYANGGEFEVVNLGGDRYDGGVVYEIKRNGKTIEKGFVDGDSGVIYNGQYYDGLLSLADGLNAKFVSASEFENSGTASDDDEVDYPQFDDEIILPKYQNTSRGGEPDTEMLDYYNANGGKTSREFLVTIRGVWREDGTRKGWGSAKYLTEYVQAKSKAEAIKMGKDMFSKKYPNDTIEKATAKESSRANLLSPYDKLQFPVLVPDAGFEYAKGGEVGRQYKKDAEASEFYWSNLQMPMKMAWIIKSGYTEQEAKKMASKSYGELTNGQRAKLISNLMKKDDTQYMKFAREYAEQNPNPKDYDVMDLKKGDIYKVVQKEHTARGQVFQFIEYVDKYGRIVLKSTTNDARGGLKYVADIKDGGIEILKRATPKSKYAQGGEVERGSAHMFVTMTNGEYKVYNGKDVTLKRGAKPKIRTNAPEGTWDKIWSAIFDEEMKKVDREMERGSAHMFVTMTNGEYKVYNGKDVTLKRGAKPKIRTNAPEGTWDKIWSAIFGDKMAKGGTMKRLKRTSC
jgi:hypothetical protein